MFIDQQSQNNKNSQGDRQMQDRKVPFSLQCDYDIEQENLELEAQKNHFSQLFEELLAYSINSQEETQSQKKRNNKVNQLRRRSNKIMKKQQEMKRIEKSQESFLQKEQKRDFNEFKQNKFSAQFIIEESQVQQGEWQRHHQEQVQEQCVIPLCGQSDDKDVLLLNLYCNINNNENCIDLNNEINKNKLLMNAFLIPMAAPILPNL